MKVLETEENKEVIERVLENLREMCEDFGPAAFRDTMPELVENIILLLDKKAFCQTKLKKGEAEEDLEDVEDGEAEDEEEEEDDEEDDDIDHDEIIFGNVSDLILSLARAYGNEFSVSFTQIAPHLVPYTSDKYP